MKLLLSAIFSTLTVLASGQSDPLMRKWVAVFSRPIGDNWIRPIEGLILDVEKNTVTIGYVFSDSLKTYELNRKSNSIRLDNKFIGKIHFLSNDSLVLDFQKRMRTRFVPIEDFKPGLNKIDLAQSAWVLKESDSDYSIDRIDFTETKWYPHGGPNIAITHDKATKYKYQGNEKWALKRIQDEWFLTLTQDQIDPIIFQVIKDYGDSLTLRCLSWVPQNQFTLSRLKPIEQAQSETIVQRLSQKKWHTVELLNYSTSFSEDTTGMPESLTTGFYVRDTTLIRKSDLTENKLSFIFGADFVFQILVDSKPFWQTKWRLSADGHYVILSEGRHPYHYIEILSLEGNELIIGKSDNFAAERKKEFFPYYYEVRLR